MIRRQFIKLAAVLSTAMGPIGAVSASVDAKQRKMASTNPLLKGISHVGISVENMDRSVHFYRDLIGLKLLGGKTGRFKGELYDTIFQLKNSQGRIAMLENGSMRIELFEFENPRGNKSDQRIPVNYNRINHICFEVVDIQQEYERLEAAGVYFHCPPQDAGFAKATYGRDPDGNVFELIEWVSK